MTTYFENHATSTSGPYEDESQACADVADIFERGLKSGRRGALAESNGARLADACERLGSLWARTTRILAWLAGHEPQMCAVIVGLVTRAQTSGRAAAHAEPQPDPYCEAGQHANCPGRLCQCPDCQHGRPAWPTV
jgi:hypothetical protein